MEVLANSTDVTTYFKLRLAADGTAATGLTITDLDLQYVRSGATPAAKVDATALAAANSAHGDNQAIEVDATDQPALYRVDWPDAAFASGVREVILTVKHASIFTEELRVNLTPVHSNLMQVGSDAQSATDLKDFADAGYDPATNKVQGVVLVDTVTTLTNLPAITANWLTAAGTAADFGTEIGAAVLSALGTGTWATAIPWNASWDAEVQSEAEDAIVAHRLDELLNADSDIDGAAPPTVGSVFHELMSKTAGSFTFDQTTDSLEAVRDRGDAAWITATGFSTLDAAGIRTAVGLASANLDTQLADLPTVAEFEARTLVAANYFDPAADTVANVTTVGSVTTKTGYALTSDYDFAKGTVAVTEAYAADGAAPTPVQALMLIQQALTEVSISSTTMTIKKLNGSDTAATLTLNDASTPTSKTRAT
jgi:hypothetical protein